ncbi:hypothetical protein L0Y69_02210 [bacterium]|nr:hypothetical protein [bacterium]
MERGATEEGDVVKVRENQVTIHHRFKEKPVKFRAFFHFYYAGGSNSTFQTTITIDDGIPTDKVFDYMDMNRTVCELLPEKTRTIGFVIDNFTSFAEGFSPDTDVVMGKCYPA